MVTFNSERPPYQRADSARVFQATPVSANPDVRNLLEGDRVFPNSNDYRFAGVIMDHHAQMGPDSSDETYVRGRVATQIYGLASIYFPCARGQKKDIHIGDTLGIAFIAEDEADPNNGNVVPAALGVYRDLLPMRAIPPRVAMAPADIEEDVRHVRPVGKITKVNYLDAGSELQVLLEPFAAMY